MASSTFLYVHLKTIKGLYLRPEEDGELSDDEHKPAKRVRRDASQSGNIAIFYVLTLEPGEQTQAADHLTQYVRADLTLHSICHEDEVEREGKRLGWMLQPSVIIHTAPAQPDDQDGAQADDSYLERCLVCVFSSSAEEQELPEQWRAAVERHVKEGRPKMRMFKLLQEEGGAFNVMRVYSSMEVELGAAADVEPKPSLRYILCDGPPASPGSAPVFDHISYSPVFESRERVLQILRMCDELKPVKELLDIADAKLKPHTSEKLPFKFIVIEGLDFTGKSTLNDKLKERFPDAEFCYGLPECLNHLRKDFDALPEVLRRAFYCLGNYIRAGELQDMCQKQHVFVDRFWHSSAAYPIAHECSQRDIPPVGHQAYDWPEDLLQPSIVLFLTVSEEVRSQRQAGRGGQTKEEQTLATDADFRWRLAEAYERMDNPACTKIDADGSKESVLEKALEHIRNLGMKV